MSLKERLGLVETVYVGVGLDRKRMRPPPGTAIIEIVGRNAHTFVVDTVLIDQPAPKGAFHVNTKPVTFVKDGPSGLCHQAFYLRFDEPDEHELIPQYLRDKVELGAIGARIWWSCESR